MGRGLGQTLIAFQIGGRQSGKTEALLAWMCEAPPGEHRCLVTHSAQEAMRLLRESRKRKLELESWQFVGIEEVMAHPGAGWEGVLFGRGGRIVLGIDNLDLVLPRLLGWPVARITATGSLTT